MADTDYRTCSMAEPGHSAADEDALLLARYLQQADREALGQLLQRYSLMVYGLCLKYLKQPEDARDATQQIFAKVIQDLSRFDVHHFKSWLYKVALNHCRMAWRSRRPYTAAPDNWDLLAPESEATDLEAHLARDRSDRWLQEALPQLPEPQRRCLEHFYLQEMSYRRIADETGFSEKQVKSHIQNGKRNLRILIEKKRRHEREE